jgi:anti-sigma regulatory factor (Ser/Thr protein kinase)
VSVLSPAGCLPSGDRGYRHDGFLYDDDDHLVRVAAPFLLEGLSAGHPVVIATTARTAGIVREAVGEHPLLHVLDRQEAYRSRTPAAIATFRRLAEEHAVDGARLRVLGEVDFGATERDWLEWQRYESVINEALADWPLWGLCVFDTRQLPQPLLESAVASHPVLVRPDGAPAVNPAFVDPATYLRNLPVPDEPLEATAPRLTAPDVSDFTGLRHALVGELAGTGGDPDLLEDFRLAVDEMVSNAVRHGRPPVGLRLWTAEDRIVCTISDGGPGWDDAFAGYGPAHGEDLSRGGMGLWLARQLCDHVDISGGHGTPGDGDVEVRLTLLLR